MNCVISGSAGLAFLIDGKRAFLLRAGDSEPTPSSPLHFHRLFSEVRDCIFLEGTDIPRARARLKRASTASDSLSLALRLLDGSFDAELRKEIAVDLEPLLREQYSKDDLAAVLAAAPFPSEMDLPGALTACKSGGAREVASLLAELRESQQTIREVREAWDAIPDAQFGDAERRREAQAQAVRGGLFLRIVRARACGERLETVLVDALADRSVSRWVPGRSNVLKLWIRTWVSDASGVQSGPILEAAPPNEDLPQVRRRERRRAGLTPKKQESWRKALPKRLNELQRAVEKQVRKISDQTTELLPPAPRKAVKRMTANIERTRADLSRRGDKMVADARKRAERVTTDIRKRLEEAVRPLTERFDVELKRGDKTVADTRKRAERVTPDVRKPTS